MNPTIKAALLFIWLTLPLSLNSTDIYHSSGGRVVLHASLNLSIIPWDSKLWNTILLVSAPADREGIHIVSDCTKSESVLYRTGSLNNSTVYIVKLDFPTSCESPVIQIGDSEGVFTDTILRLPFTTVSEIIDMSINTDSQELLSIMRAGSSRSDSATGTTIVQKIERIQTLYRNVDSSLRSDIARDILLDREDTKYISPVAWYILPTRSDRVPGAGRSYRKDTTDGIHHGWDIMAPYGTPVRALSKGKVLRVVDNWKWSEFATMGKWPFSDDDKLRNLDIFRGNQIWLQSMDGNVTFYSHLSKISSTLRVGASVEKWAYLGNIGASGVPEKNYKNIHLHFEIQENPFRKDVKKPSFLDIMRWEYVWEHTRRDQMSEKVRQIFE